MNAKQRIKHEDTIHPALKLAIQQAVDDRLLNLPAETYCLIERMVSQKIAVLEKMYQRIAFVLLFALTGILAAFFHITAENASAKASEAIVQSALGQKLQEVEEAHAKIQNIKNQLVVKNAEVLESALKISAKLNELEIQDNIVRFSHNGNLVFNLQDGELRLKRRNSDKEIIMYLDEKGRFRITDGNTTYDVLEGTFYRPISAP